MQGNTDNAAGRIIRANVPDFPPMTGGGTSGPPPVDLVNHPPHYTKGGIETIDFIEAKGLGYKLGNVVKYVVRADEKGTPLQDLKKAQWYLNREIAIREAIGASGAGVFGGILRPRGASE